MEIKDLKPDFERIAPIYSIIAITGIPFPERTNFFLRSYEKEWQSILKGETSYENKDNINLRKLIEDFSLMDNYNDLLFLAFRFSKQEKLGEDLKRFMKLIPGKKKELLQALEFIYVNELAEIKVVLKHRIKNLSIAINNQILLGIIREALLNEFIETDLYFQQGFVKPEDIPDWGKYFDFINIEEEAKPIKKGRKRKPSQGGKIEILQMYLQLFTDLKADKENTISRKQASFIFKFLSELNLMPDNLSWQEDNIRHILNKFRELKESGKFYDYKIALDEYAKYYKKMRTKLMKINKNKKP